MTDEHPMESGHRLTAAALLNLRLLGIGVARATFNGKILDADDMLCALVGRTIEEVKALPDLWAVVGPEHRATITSRRLEWIQGATTARANLITLVGPGGRSIPVQTATAAIDDCELLMFLRDMRDDQRLELLAQQYAHLIENMPTGVVVWDAAGVDDPMEMQLTWANREASKAFGVDLTGCAGRTIRDVFPQPELAVISERALLLRGSDRVEHFADLSVGSPGGLRRTYEFQAIGLPGDSVAFLVRDVTAERVGELRRRRLLERIVDTSDEQRRNLAMEVHDDPIQQIAAATMLVEAMRRTPPTSGADDRLATVEQAMRSAMTQLRRLVFELSPPELVESGLAAALRSAAAYLFADTNTEVTIDVIGLEDVREVLDVLEPVHALDPAHETAAFRIASEALTNVRKHAMATHVSVVARADGHRLEMLIRDDGVGFDHFDRPGHLGIQSMRERASSVGGSCTTDSEPGQTEVRVILPLTGGVVDPDAERNWAQIVQVPAVGELTSLQMENASLRAAHRTAVAQTNRWRAEVACTMALWRALAVPTLAGQDLLDAATQAIGTGVLDACSIRLLAADRTYLAHRASWHRNADQLAFLDEYLFDDRPLDRPSNPLAVMMNDAPIIFDRRRQQWLPGGRVPPPAPIEPMYALGVPIHADGVVGVLTVSRDETDRPFDAHDVDAVQLLADLLGCRLPPMPHW